MDSHTFFETEQFYTFFTRFGMSCLKQHFFFFAFAVLIFIFYMNAAMRSIFPSMNTPLIARVLINFIAIVTSVVNFIMNNKIDMVLLI